MSDKTVCQATYDNEADGAILDDAVLDHISGGIDGMQGPKEPEQLVIPDGQELIHTVDLRDLLDPLTP